MLDRLGLKITAKKSTITNSNLEKRLSGAGESVEGILFSYYYRSLLYADLNIERYKTETYAKAVMYTTTKNSQKLEKDPQEKVTSKS